MSIVIHPVKAFSDNYIWVLVNDSNKQAIVIDPGQAEPVVDYLDEHKLELTSIWITHQHHDHVGGVAQLLEHYPMTHVVAHSEHGIKADQTVNEGSNVSAWGMSVTVWAVSGHTEYHLAYILNKDNKKYVFCGDTLFSAGCGRVFSGSMEQLYNSLKRISSLDEDTLLYPAHEYTANNLRFGLTVEPDNQVMKDTLIDVMQQTEKGKPSLPVSLGHEFAVNVFLRTGELSVIEGASRLAKINNIELKDTKPLTIFTVLRRLKDNF